jgi:uncharacterized protein YidB (DUF937 family)
MPLLDQILGGVGGRAGAVPARGGRGMSPVVTALMLALAAKAAQSWMQHRREAGSAPSHAPGQPTQAGGGPTAGMGDLGGMIAGMGGAGALGALVDQFRKSGHGDLIDSWIGRGANQPAQPHQLAEAIGDQHVQELSQQTGVPREELLRELSDELPQAVDQLTPQGRLPDDQEIGRMIGH